MKPRKPIAQLPTHEVINMPPHMGDQDLWQDDRSLRHWTKIQGGAGHADHLANAGRLAGLDETFEKAGQANHHGPELRAFDRHGMRINADEFHPAYHDLMDLAISNKAHNFAWHYYEPALLHSANAAARGIRRHDIIRVFNRRGSCLCAAVLSEDIRRGVIQISTGAWVDVKKNTGLCQ